MFLSLDFGTHRITVAGSDVEWVDAKQNNSAS
jgi:hypothetical protein